MWLWRGDEVRDLVVHVSALRIGQANLELALSLTIACALAVGGCSRPVPEPVPETTPAAPTSAGSAAFPLQKSVGQRCLVDQTRKPFLLHGDSPWSLLVQLTREEVERYLEDRQRRGFNTLLVNLLEVDLRQYGNPGANGPRNVYGEAPFVVPGDYARPNEKYFAHVDWVLTRAAEYGFLVLLTPSYLGYEGGSTGWYREMRDNGVERLRSYGRYLGMRYRNLTNIVWIHGGDYNPPERALMQAIIDGIREMNPDALHSFHGSRGTAARAFVGEETAWLDVNTIYTDENGVVAAAHTEYTASSLPFFLIEARYEGEGASEAVVRAQAYQAILSGACGQLMGNKPIWSFDTVWKSALDSPGARSMTQIRSILEALGWWRLRPAYDGFIVDGIGAGALRAVSAVAEDKRRAVVYVPSPRDIIVNTAGLKGPRIKSRWIDPANAHSVAVTRSSFDKSQRFKLRPPEHNSSGYGDWILVLESKN